MATVLLVVLGVIVAWIILEEIWIIVQLVDGRVQKFLRSPANRAPPGRIEEKREECDRYSRCRRIEDGIEWISYHPKAKKHETPILMVHGMWHGAWCWERWQVILAERGWESHAISLPGHGASPEQRPIRRCTLGYYLAFVRDALNKLPSPPILMGHSMGGALTQWYLRFIGNLPATVLVAPWALASGIFPSASAVIRTDPLGVLLTMLTYKAEYTRNPRVAGRLLLGKAAVVTPDELYARLGSESALVLIQHMLPWKIPPTLNTPILYLGGECDASIPEPAGRRAAAAYKADYRMIEGAGHNLMMEHNYRETAGMIADWLEKKQLK